ncbi:MAG: sporulation transcriptional regulator SpoIIID [Clostridia bacterium]|jgi:putative DeoR family transcriptional regulator (stage III sporulation protein D)|nr:sporulation transcriptional regulator SpoIIID [Clostridia bacterium]
MNFDISCRAQKIADYIIDTHSTVRKAAKIFDISKSTVHIDVTKRLKKIDISLYLKVKDILKVNYNERHIRGGIATKNKYIKLKLQA